MFIIIQQVITITMEEKVLKKNPVNVQDRQVLNLMPCAVLDQCSIHSHPVFIQNSWVVLVFQVYRLVCCICYHRTPATECCSLVVNLYLDSTTQSRMMSLVKAAKWKSKTTRLLRYHGTSDTNSFSTMAKTKHKLWSSPIC